MSARELDLKAGKKVQTDIWDVNPATLQILSVIYGLEYPFYLQGGAGVTEMYVYTVRHILLS